MASAVGRTSAAPTLVAMLLAKNAVWAARCMTLPPEYSLHLHISLSCLLLLSAIAYWS
jgi:hypothetical protein